MVGQSVEKRGRHLGIAEDTGPSRCPRNRQQATHVNEAARFLPELARHMMFSLVGAKF